MRALILIGLTLLLYLSSVTAQNLKSNYESNSSEIQNLSALENYEIDEDDLEISDSYSWIYEHKDIKDLLNLYFMISEDVEILKKDFKEINSPYKNFLINYFLPVVDFDNEINNKKNIEKVNFSSSSDFLNQDIKKKWIEYLETGFWDNDLQNNVKSIEGNVQTFDDKYVEVIFDVEFETEKRKDFFILMNKLLVSGTHYNIVNIYDFMYNIFEDIKDNNDFDKNVDKWKIIWKDLKNLLDWESPRFLDKQVVSNAINRFAQCENTNCYEEFVRESQSIPMMAKNLINSENEKSKKEWFKNFLDEIPPATNVSSFNVETQDNKNFGYKWEISFSVYWRTEDKTIDVKEKILNEVEEIDKNFEHKSQKEKRTEDYSLNPIEFFLQRIRNFWDTADTSTSRWESFELTKMYNLEKDSEQEVLEAFEKFINSEVTQQEKINQIWTELKKIVAKINNLFNNKDNIRNYITKNWFLPIKIEEIINQGNLLRALQSILFLDKKISLSKFSMSDKAIENYSNISDFWIWTSQARQLLSEYSSEWDDNIILLRNFVRFCYLYDFESYSCDSVIDYEIDSPKIFLDLMNFVIDYNEKPDSYPIKPIVWERISLNNNKLTSSIEYNFFDEEEDYLKLRAIDEHEKFLKNISLDILEEYDYTTNYESVENIQIERRNIDFKDYNFEVNYYDFNFDIPIEKF